MGLYIFIYIWLATGIRFVFTDCGTISPEQRNVTEGEKVQLKFLPKYGRTAEIWFFYWINSEYNKDICWSSNSSCISEKYHLYNNLLSIENFTKTDEGQYTVKCDSGFWSSKAFLNNQPADRSISQERHVHLKNRPVMHSVTAQVDSKTVTIKVLATTSASNEHELHQKTISLENPKEYHSMTKSATAKVESVSVKTEVSANHLHRREPSEQEAPAVQLRQVDSKYETIIPVTDRAASIQERELYKMIKVEKENMPEYEAVE